MDFSRLHEQVAFRKSNGKIIWQPRISCWYRDKIFSDGKLPAPYTGMSRPELYRELGCSARVYEYRKALRKIFPQNVRTYEKKISEYRTEYTIECPKGKITSIRKANSSNYGTMPEKWWVNGIDDLRIQQWIEENTTWEWDQSAFEEVQKEWGDLGAPTVFIERINIQRLFIDLAGYEQGIYLLYDYPDAVESYFKALNESQERLLKIINDSPIDIINFGDNIHAGIVSPELFEKYILPSYQKRNEILHSSNKFTSAHWDGDTKSLLPYVRETGLDGIEAVTPKPQGDVTLKEVKKFFGDEIFLLDGIAAILFDKEYAESELETQAREVINLFAPKLIMGISDEISSTGDIERVKRVGEIVEEYNALL